MELRQLSINDGENIYTMLQGIPKTENSFTNPVYGMTYKEFKKWLIKQDQWSRNENLPDGFVAQTIYWLFEHDMPIGIGKIRHELTEHSRKNGGNVGYAISEKYRGKGYGNKILELLLLEARNMNLEEIMLTVDKYNYASKRVIEKNGGQLFNENEKKWYFRFYQ